jgi:uncharacterized protein HemX
MIAYLLGALGAALGLTATILTIRANRIINTADARKKQQEAGDIEDARITRLRNQLDSEYAKRREVEDALERRDERIAAHERRIAALEAQVRGFGGIPIPEMA